MMKFKRLLTVGFMALLCAGTATAASQLNSVQVTPAANAVTISLHTTGSYAHKEYRPDEHQMFVDLTDVADASTGKHIVTVDSAALKGYQLTTYTSASGSEVTRLELTLGEDVTASVSDVSGGVEIQLSGGGSGTPATPKPPAPVAEAPHAPAAAPKPELAKAATPASPAPARLAPVATPAMTPPATKDVPKNTAQTVTKDAAKNEAKNAAKNVAKNAAKSPAAAARRAPASDTIRSVSAHQGQGTVDIVIDGATSAHSFLLKEPDRLVLDFSNAVLKPSVKSIAVHSKDVLQVRVSRFQSEPPVTRIVIDLSGPRTFDVVPSEKRVTVRINSGGVPSAPLTAASQPAPAPVAAASVAPDEEAGTKGPATEAAATERATVPKASLVAATETSASAAQPAVKMARLNLPVSKQSDATAAAKPTADAAPQHPDQETFEPQAPAAEPQATVPTAQAPPQVEAPKQAVAPPLAPAPPPPAAAPPQTPAPPQVEAPKQAEAPPPPPPPAPAPPQIPAPAQAVALQQASAAPAAPAPLSASKYTGEPISVNLKDVDLKDFFRLIHEISGLNVVLDPSVRGNVTLVLDDVPWDQALDIVLKNNSLDRELQGNVLRIAASDTLRKEAVDRRAQSEAVALAVDRQTVTRFLSYAKAAAVTGTIKKFLTARGDVISDERTNSLIISDIPSVLPTLDRLISQLDKKSQEVEIEARVVSASRSFGRDLGFQLGFNWGNGTSVIGGSQAGSTITTPSGTTSTVPLFSNYPVAATGGSGISFSNITPNYGIDAILTAAESHGLAKVLSRPRIVTQSNIKAEIKQGLEIPVYTAATGTSNASSTYVNAVLRLSVTPQVTADNTIFLTVDVEDTEASLTQINGNPELTTEQATTQVLVTDGGTVVIGGVIKTSNSVSIEQTPVLGSIPLLGNLFKSRQVSTETDELIFFITPKIVKM